MQEIVEIFNFPWTSLEATKEKWDRYYSEQKAHIRAVCIAKVQNKFIGYGSLLKISEYPGFKSCGIPEIHYVWISKEYRGHGFGKN